MTNTSLIEDSVCDQCGHAIDHDEIYFTNKIKSWHRSCLEKFEENNRIKQFLNEDSDVDIEDCAIYLIENVLDTYHGKFIEGSKLYNSLLGKLRGIIDNKQFVSKKEWQDVESKSNKIRFFFECIVEKKAILRGKMNERYILNSFDSASFAMNVLVKSLKEYYDDRENELKRRKREEERFNSIECKEVPRAPYHKKGGSAFKKSAAWLEIFSENKEESEEEAEIAALFEDRKTNNVA
ncbi:hypothetical protein ACWOE3_12970 [Enterococcus dispar]|uniref:Uncharacterized protein n=2 Tax=Enterococcus dispar TaxID=44009 RepID=S0KRN9_9ENTE|nr:hypothetical protein [Enterococcus dispar]EOT43675.1 hypothetical protein OMK_00231 [Enterococcus dispar ATCC 51266]EOW85653.1 hypothetical protein I569_00968 [Enterococcus dispar ATCC 51266]